MNTLLAGFKGKNNSAKIQLDLINPKNKVNKLYLENDFSICKNQLELQKNRNIVEKIFSQYIDNVMEG